MEEKIVLLRNRGKIDPKKAEEYAARGGYEGLRKALVHGWKRDYRRIGAVRTSWKRWGRDFQHFVSCSLHMMLTEM